MTSRGLRRSLTGLLVVAVLGAAPAAFGFEMMKNMMTSLDLSAKRGDARATAIMLDTISMFGGKEFEEWKPIAQKGAAAARRGDMATAKASCKSCHDKYHDGYKQKYGSGSTATLKPKPGPKPLN
jgi:hypothetical protein